MVFKTGYNMGPARLVFGLATDSPECPSIDLILKANLVPEWQVDDQIDKVKDASVGQSMVRHLRVFHRRLNDSKKSFPSRISHPSSIEARFQGEPQVSQLGDVVETSRQVEVQIPPSAEAGDHRADLIFHGENSQEYKFNFFWRTVPRISATPNGFVIRRSQEPVELTVIVRSLQGEPFAITDIAAPFLVDKPAFKNNLASSHVVKLRIDPERISSEAAGDIRISTSLAEQPLVKISVIVLPSDPGSRP